MVEQHCYFIVIVNRRYGPGLWIVGRKAVEGQAKSGGVLALYIYGIYFGGEGLHNQAVV